MRGSLEVKEDPSNVGVFLYHREELLVHLDVGDFPFRPRLCSFLKTLRCLDLSHVRILRRVSYPIFIQLSLKGYDVSSFCLHYVEIRLYFTVFFNDSGIRSIGCVLAFGTDQRLQKRLLNVGGKGGCRGRSTPPVRFPHCFLAGSMSQRNQTP